MSDGIGRGVLQQFAAASQAEVDQEAVRLRDAISQGRAAADLGWIVDLRSFSGGGMWAAVAGLGELLGSPSKVGSFRNGEGAEYEWWVSCSGAGLRSPDTTSTLASAQAADCTPARKPVAMLIGPMTASAGEGVAVAFRGMRGVKFFGSPTRGAATGNEVVRLEDGAKMAITAGYMYDRDGKLADQRVTPDLSTEGSDVDARAASWLRSQAPR